MNGSDRQFKRGAVPAAVDAMQQSARKQRDAGLSRRRFLQAGAATAAFGGLPWLASCGGGDDNPAPERPPEVRTIFFNHSHLDTAGKQMMLQVGMKRHALRPIAEVPHVLERERANNRFLAAVPDPQITHAVEGVEVDPDFISLGCVYTPPTANGQWTMASVHIILPQSASTVAYASIAARPGPVQPSLKRSKYGVPAAASAQDLHEEQALLDTASHSATLIAAHKDMMGYDGGAAGTVINVHVMNSNAVGDLDDALGALPTASPEGSTNPAGWATLQPVVNNVTQQPFTMSTDGRIVYMPVLHPRVALIVGQGVAEVLPNVQDDTTLGADITSQPAGSTLRGKLWARNDGTPTVVQTAPPPGAAATPAAADQAPSMAVNWPAGGNHWLDCTATVTALGSGIQQLDVSYSNTGLRYLSCAVEFEDNANPPNLIQMSTMPGFNDRTWVSSPPNFSYDPGEDGSKTRLHLGGISCIGTVMGIPVFTDSAFYGSLGITMKLPNSVHKVRLLAGGLGTGSNNYSDTIGGGVAGTMLMNYCINSVFAAIGAIPNMDAVYSLVDTILSTFLDDLASGVLDDLSGNGLFSPQFMIDQGMNMINMVLGMFSAYGVAPTIKAFAAGLGEILGEAIAEESVKNAIWFVGIAFSVESAVAGFVDFGLTTAAVAQSPFTYVTELVFTHDVTVTINANTKEDTAFPKSANAFKVTATFDDGKPWDSGWLPTQEYLPQPPLAPATSTTYTFKGVPFGGDVQFECLFVQRALDGSDADNILLGRGSTEKLANDDSTTYALTVDELEFPVSAATVYQHQQRTYLDPSNEHVWVQEAAPSTPPAAFPCGSAGQICTFNGIAVRQGNIDGATMLAYAWRGQNASGGADVEQAALTNADNPPAAYTVATLPGGGSGGLTLAISRDAAGRNNYYVDASGKKPMIRAINFDTGGNPTLDGPDSKRAFGMLNYGSSALLVHPSGALVSVSGPNQRLEILTPPDAPVDDTTASTNYIAQVLGFTGATVGRMNSVVGATITNDGTLLVLEGGSNNRIQAFDLGANPVRFFANAAVPYFLPLTGLERSKGWTHLDVQADFTGLLFLLSFNQTSGVYQVTIYDSLSKLQQPLSTTTGIFAARIGIDHWRNLYSLNYQPIVMQGTGAAPAITEPSVSLWTPCNRGQTC